MCEASLVQAPFSRAQRLWLFAIIVAATALRLWDLTLADIWYDEAVSASQARLGFFDMLVATGRDNYPPLHNIVLHPIVHLFGDGALALRLPSVLFGAALLLVAADLGRLLFGARAGLVTAALIAASPLHVYYAQDARMYTLFAFLAALSMWSLVRWAAVPSRARATVYVIATVLCLYAHFYAVFIVLAQNVWVVVLWRRRTIEKLSPWAILQVITGLAFLPWAVIMVHRTGVLQKYGFWLPEPDLDRTLEVPLAYWSWAAPLAVALIVAALWRRLSRPHFLLGLWLALPIALPWLLSFVVQPIFWPRYTIAASTAGFLLVAAGLVRIAPRAYVVVAVTLGLVALERVPILQYRGAEGRHPSWHLLAAELATLVRPGDEVIVWPRYEATTLDYHLHGRLAVEPIPRFVARTSPTDVARFETPVVASGAVWLVEVPGSDAVPQPDIDAALGRTAGEARDYPKLRLIRYAPVPEVP